MALLCVLSSIRASSPKLACLRSTEVADAGPGPAARRRASEATWCPAEEAAFFDVLREMAGSAVERVLAAAGQRLPRRSPKQARAAAKLGSASLVPGSRF